MGRRTVDPPPRTLSEQVEYLMKHLECVDRHVTDLEQNIEERLDNHEVSMTGMTNHSSTLLTSHNQLTDHVNYLLRAVEKIKQSWNNWDEWTPIDQEEEEEEEKEVSQLPVREGLLPVEREQSTPDYSSRTLLDITPVITPVQTTRDPQQREQAGASRVSTPEYACSRLALTSLKGVTRIYVEDPETTSQRDGTTRQLPPRPSDGVLVEVTIESKLHSWLLQGMTRRGNCSDYYEQYKPTTLEVWSKEDSIKYDQYIKAFAHIGPAPSTEGRLMNMVEQVIQNFLRTMKGLSPACEFYTKLLLHGIYDFLEQLRTLETATEQATQTFLQSRKQRNRSIHSRRPCLLHGSHIS